MAESGPVGQQCGDVFWGYHTWDHCSNKSAEAGCISCIPVDLCRSAILETSVCAWVADGLFYSFSKHRQFITLHFFHDQRSKNIAESPDCKNPLGNCHRSCGILFS